MANKCIIGFGDGKFSWTESYVHSDNTMGLNGVMQDLVKLAQARSQLLGNGVSVSYLRVNDTSNPRSVLTQRGLPQVTSEGKKGYNKAFVIPENAANDYTSDFPYSTLLCRKFAASQNYLYSGNLYLSGCPDLDQVDQGLGITDGIWLKAFNSFVNQLLNTWALMVTDRDTTPAQNVTAIGANAPYALTVPNHGYTSGTQVAVSGMKLGPGLNPARGRYYITVTDVNTFTLNGWLPIPNAGPPSVTMISGGTVRKVVKKVVPISNVTQQGFTKHSRGGSFLQPHGRSRRRKATS